MHVIEEIPSSNMTVVRCVSTCSLEAAAGSILGLLSSLLNALQHSAIDGPTRKHGTHTW